MALTSSWTDATGASAASTGAAVTPAGATTGADVAATTGADVAATTGAFAAGAFFAFAATGAAGATVTAATTTVSSDFLETFFITLTGVELIILDAVEVFMAGIRTYSRHRIQFWVKVFKPPLSFFDNSDIFYFLVMVATKF